MNWYAALTLIFFIYLFLFVVWVWILKLPTTTTLTIPILQLVIIIVDMSDIGSGKKATGKKPTKAKLSELLLLSTVEDASLPVPGIETSSSSSSSSSSCVASDISIETSSSVVPPLTQQENAVEDVLHTIYNAGDSQFKTANTYLHRNFQYRKETGLENIYVFDKNLHFGDLFTLGTTSRMVKVNGKDVEQLGIELKKKNEADEFCSFVTPLGVLQHSSLNYLGNRYDVKFPPKTIGDIKQSISFSARQYDPDSEDANEPGHDPNAMEFIQSCKENCTNWFLQEVLKQRDTKALKEFVTKAKNDLADRGNKKPTDEQLIDTMRSAMLQTARKDGKRNIFTVGFATKLFRPRNKGELKRGVEFDKWYLSHGCPNAWFREVFLHDGLVFRDVPFYSLKSPEERSGDMSPTLWKKVSRKDVSIANGTIGMLRFQPQAMTEAGGKLSVVFHINGVYLYCNPTSMSADVPPPILEPEVKAAIKRKFPEFESSSSTSNGKNTPSFLTGYDSTFDIKALPSAEDENENENNNKRLRLTDGQEQQQQQQQPVITCADDEQAMIAFNNLESELNHAHY